MSGWFQAAPVHVPERAVVVVDLGAQIFRVALLDGDGCTLALQEAEAVGVDRQGLLQDLAPAAELLARLVRRVETLADHEAETILTTVPGPLLHSYSSDGKVAVPEGVVQSAHLLRAAEHAVFSEEISPGSRLVHALRRACRLDGQDHVLRPTGLAGHRLAVDFFWVLLEQRAAEAIDQLFMMAELPKPIFVASPLATAIGGLTRDEAILGAVSVDLGHAATGMTVWRDEVPQAQFHLPCGGRHLTGDLKQVFQVSSEAALDIMKSQIPAVAEMADEEGRIRVGRKRIKRRKAARVLQSRLEDTFHRVRGLLSTQGYWTEAKNGIVLSGGVSRLEGVQALAETVFECSVRIAGMEAEKRQWTWPPTHEEIVSLRARPDLVTLAGALEFARLNILNLGVVKRGPQPTTTGVPAPQVHDLRGALGELEADL